jgi:glucokinase
MSESIIGIDIGGTNVRVGLLNQQLELINKETAFTTDFDTSEAFLLKVKSMVRHIDPYKRAVCIGIALPIPWKKRKHIISDATNVPCLEDVAFEKIRSLFPEYKVYFENDVNVIALLESDYCVKNIDKKHKNLVYITVSTGIGSGVIINRTIYHGSNGYAGEIGSMIVSGGEENVRTLEEICSGTALNEESIRLYGENATAELLFEKYLENETEAVTVIESWKEYLSRGLAAVVQMVDPDVVILGGSVILNNQWLIEALTEKTREKVLGHLADKVNLVVSRYGTDAGVIGAGYFAFKIIEGE